MARKPIVTARPVSLFGDVSEEEMNGDPTVPDRFFIKGYSDRRREFDAAMKEYEAGRGPRPKAMDFRLQCVRVFNAKDGHDKTKAAAWMAKGYRYLQYEEARKHGLDIERSAFEKGADGSARMGEYVVMIADQKAAARNLAEVQQRNDEQLMSALATTQSVAGQVLQMAPQVEEPVAKK